MSLVEDFLCESNAIEGYCFHPDNYKPGADTDGIPEVGNQIAAWEAMRQNRARRIDHVDILRLHQITMSGLMKNAGHEGCYRNAGVWIGMYKAVPAGQILPLLAYFLEQFNEKVRERELNFLELHYLFESIHPFFDGNGRVGRLLWAWDSLRNSTLVRPILDYHRGSAGLDCGFHCARRNYYSAIQDFRDFRLPEIQQAVRKRRN